MKNKAINNNFGLYQYASIFEHFDDFVAISSINEFVIEYANPAAFQMFDFSDENELVGKEILTFSKIALTDEKIAGIHENLSNGNNSYREELLFVGKSGKEFWGLFRANKISINDKDYVLYKITDISDLKKIKYENYVNNQRLKFAIEGNGDGLWDWHMKTNNIYLSKRWKNMLGFEDDELENNLNTWENLIHPDDFETTMSYVEDYLSDFKNKLYDIEFRLLCKNGEYKWINSRGMIVKEDKDGNPVRFVGTHSDIDKLKNIQQELKLYSSRLEKSNADIKQFAYITTHDLKEPLRAISNNIQILKMKNKSVLDDNSIELIDYSVDGCKKLTGIIKELLDYAQLDLNNDHVDIVDLNDLMKKVIGNIDIYLKSKNVAIEVKLLPSDLLGHKLHLTRLFQNIIVNAVKYNDKDDPKIIIDCVLKNNEYIISINDNGMGIAKEHEHKIYEIFKRLNTGQDSESVGMGLAVCKKIVEAHNGQMWHESEIGVGTTFYMSFPIVSLCPI